MSSRLFRRKPISQVGSDHDSEHKLHKVLKLRDLTALGIAAIIGAGIFSTIGKASFEGGPGVVFLFLFTAIACGFAAFCYAEFASMIPVSGSAYTYAYVAFGELMAWIIGWALIMEYSVGNITVAISWSDYFCGFLSNMGINLPQWVQMDWFTAHQGFKDANDAIASGTKLTDLPDQLKNAFQAYSQSPTLGTFHFVADLPALLIIFIISLLVYIGIKESKNASNVMVMVKLAIVFLVIIVGAFYVQTGNWSPFMPNGVGGILKGVSAVFFAYIGFDAISTTAEECENPQRDLPKSMMYSIIICTILYVLIALVLTGMVNYKELNVGDPLAHVFDKLHLDWISGLVAVSAIFAMASVLLVFQIGQPRIWMSMSRDGLLPPIFKRLHHRFKTPYFATIVSGIVVAIPALFLNLTTVTDLCSIGTLFAFVLVCGGLLMLRNTKDLPESRYKVPYFNSKFIIPIAVVASAYFIQTKHHDIVTNFLNNEKEVVNIDTILSKCDTNQIHDLSNYAMYYHGKDWVAAGATLETYLKSLDETEFRKVFIRNSLKYESYYEKDWDKYYSKIPMWIWLVSLFILTILAFFYNLSLIPLLGVICCLYMMAQIPLQNWIGFGIWLIVGLILYFCYGYKHSKLNLYRG